MTLQGAFAACEPGVALLWSSSRRFRVSFAKSSPASKKNRVPNWYDSLELAICLGQVRV